MNRARWIFIVPLLILFIYLIRGAHFLDVPLLLIGLSFTGVAMMLYGAIERHTLGYSPRRWVMSATPVMVIAAIAMVVAEPSNRDARAALDRGDLTTARNILDALGEETDPELAPLYTSLHGAVALTKQRCGEVVPMLERLPAGSFEFEKAREHADRLAIAAVDKHLRERELSAADTAWDCASAKARSVAAPQALALAVERASTCLERKDYVCAAKAIDAIPDAAKAATWRERHASAVQLAAKEALDRGRTEISLARRIAAKREALALLRDSSVPDNTIAALTYEIGTDEAKLVLQEDVERKRLASEATRRAAEESARVKREADAEKKRIADEQRRERMRDYSPLSCNDGTLSPSCTCGGPRRGCCSHHGGVAGCSVD